MVLGKAAGRQEDGVSACCRHDQESQNGSGFGCGGKGTLDGGEHSARGDML